MQTVNNLIFDSTNALNGQWQDVSNMVQFSIHVINLEGKVWIEASNDPAAKTDGANVLTAPSAPTLSQFTYGNLTGQGTLDVKITYITKNGETLPSTNTTLAVSDGNVLQIASPAADANGYAIGWRPYIKIGTVWVLQTPKFSGPYNTPGAVPIGTPFNLTLGVYDSGVAAPAASTSGGASAGVNITGNLAVAPYVAPYPAPGEVQIITDGTASVAPTQAMVNPSCLAWKWVRVCKDNTTQTKETKAWLAGAMG